MSELIHSWQYLSSAQQKNYSFPSTRSTPLPAGSRPLRRTKPSTSSSQSHSAYWSLLEYSVAPNTGLNVHPSLLPDLRGPAPIHHTLLQGRKTTGITLQTLHPKHFDQGMILAQTPELDTPHPDACTPKMLIEYLAPLGGRLLVESLKERLFVPPLEDAGWYAREGQKLWHAPKITKQDRHIIWTNSQSTPKPDQHTQSPVTWTAEEILRRDRVLGDLWDTTTYQGLLPEEGKAKRVVFHGWEEVMGDDSVLESLASGDRLEVGVPYVTENSNAPPYLYFKTQDEPPKLVRVTSCTVEGGKRGAGISEMMAIRTRRS
ncbi:Methionyl-tRNA formyltransferase [Coniosporium tulheliwenetii]|uniref:Methionyl-tRNA formyltransferase n=1 Tax=Coniosporium tulheliwenetii TaxID=3383036 RepID=A0ACC2Z4E1_9PEZI|nr:Methionyl-tRNA formyltransferase [Cladosporium sp. JES 115]